MFKHNIVKKGKGATIELQGELTIHNAEDLKKVIEKELINKEKIIFDFDEVTKVDSAGLQIICSFYITYYKDKDITVANFIAENLLTLAHYCMSKRGNCESIDKKCLFVQ